MMKLVVPLLMLLTACGKKSYVHSITPMPVRTSSEIQAVVADGGQVDIVWVIDNSGSMSTIQNQVIANAEMFMQEFTRASVLEWRLGLVSTDVSDQPYLGFNPIFDDRTPDPTRVFSRAVAQLGIGGDYNERSFQPVIDKLNSYVTFLRPQAHLIVIMVSDEPEQSAMSAAQFVQRLVDYKQGRSQMVRVYGAFNARDFGCNQGTVTTYAGSPYEAAINATNGKVYSTCSPRFGADLADLGQDIVSAISAPTLLLRERPVPKSIRVHYKGQELPPGLRVNGGKWLYDDVANGVRFHDMMFVDIHERNVNITYEVDEGQIE